MHCPMVKVCCEFHPNWTNATKVIQQKIDMLTECQKDGMMEGRTG